MSEGHLKLSEELDETDTLHMNKTPADMSSTIRRFTAVFALTAAVNVQLK